MTSFLVLSIKRNASTIEPKLETSRMSRSSAIAGGAASETASMSRCLPIFMATARAPIESRICLASASDTMWFGAASSTSAAV